MDIQKSFDWFLDPLKHHYFDFEGRVARESFWMFVLWSFIIGFVIGIFSDELMKVFWLVILLPSLGLGARRLHDTGMSGWWQLIGLVPLLGWVALIFLCARPGVVGANMYGADPHTTTAVSPMPAATTSTTSTTPVEVERVTPTE